MHYMKAFFVTPLMSVSYIRDANVLVDDVACIIPNDFKVPHHRSPEVIIDGPPLLSVTVSMLLHGNSNFH